MATDFIRFIRKQWTVPVDPKASFSGMNIIVTGANTGLGFEAAIKFTALGASRVILGVRNLEKGEMAKKIIEQRTERKGVVEAWKLDMDSYDSIREFAKLVSAELDHLDIVVLNAGVYMFHYQQSSYGWEETLQVNVLSTALLGLLLLPILKETAKTTKGGHRPVLEIVSSGLHRQVTIREDLLNAGNILQSYNTADAFNSSQQYPLSKLCVIYVMQMLASLAKSEHNSKGHVLVLAVCPGACKSDLARGSTGLTIKTVKAIANATFMRTAEEGSRTFVSGTTLGDEAHGRFWQYDQIQQ